MPTTAKANADAAGSSQPQATAAFHRHLLFSYWYGATDPCPSQTRSKALYASHHGYGWRFEMRPAIPQHLARVAESPQLAEAVWYKVIALRAAFDGRYVHQCTFFDSDTLIVQPELSLESIFSAIRPAARQAPDTEHSSTVASAAAPTSRQGRAQCTVYLQADPLMLNAGFISVRRSSWVLNTFLPTWLSYSEDGRFNFRHSKRENFHAPEQAALVATVLSFALRTYLQPDHPLVRGNASRHACTDPHTSASLHNMAAEYFAQHPDEPPPQFSFVGFETFHTYRARMTRPTHRLYLCASYLYHAVLSLNQTASSVIRVDDENSICLLGYDGPQINRHHYVPTWLSDLANGTLSGAKGSSRHFFGSGFSTDMLLVHQKGLPARLCSADWLPPPVNRSRS